MSAPGAPTEFAGVLETSLYYPASRAGEIESFYLDRLGLPVVSRWPDGLALRLGPGVLLLFEREGLAGRDGPIAEHGTPGPGHVCLLAAAGGYEAWRSRLGDAGVEITHEHRWGDGLRSFYFHDPAGNLLEIAEGDIWPR